jgi:hypothetical protein
MLRRSSHLILGVRMQRAHIFAFSKVATVMHAALVHLPGAGHGAAAPSVLLCSMHMDFSSA